MIRKIVVTLVPAFVLAATSLPAQAAGTFGFEFSASSPQDQLAWVKQDDASQVAAVQQPAAEKKTAKSSNGHWDPLGVATSNTLAKKAAPKMAKDRLITPVSAFGKEKKGLSKADLWDMIH